ncbi:MAG: SWIM zinc finger family protein, partial [Verrucomicrobia bacterium]|nr:SWIM zinc finger family protein [Verrucomicrobiota bacterium]
MHDWSETWLQQVAGWKAVKEGLALARSGMVDEAVIRDDECRGVVGGAKKRKVRIRRTGAGHVETFCNCPENQRSGAMCEHAVAIVTVACTQPAAKATRLESPQIGPTEEKPAPASRIDFFPRWRDEWKAGRLSVKISASARESDEGDEVIQRWFEKMGITNRPKPWVLVIHRQQADAFFTALTWHSEAMQNDQTIVFNSQAPQVAVISQRTGSVVTLTRAGETGQFFGTQPCSWLLHCDQLFQTSDRKLQNSLYKLFTEKLLEIPVNELLTDNLLMKSLAP